MSAKYDMNGTLDRYVGKREFTRTPEPAPKQLANRQGPLLFVVQKHAARHLHYDLRLELDGVLKSWAVPKGPSMDHADKRLAVEVEDHPLDYASFEGFIPAKEYGAGNVIVWDCGVYSPDEGQQYSFRDRPEAESRLRRELLNGKVSVFLRGEKLKGSFALVRTSTPKQWLLLKHQDRFAQQNDVLARDQSVLSGRTVESNVPTVKSAPMDVERLVPAGPLEAMPKTMSPMLAEIGGDRPRSDPKWSYEPKLDGYRVIAFVRDGKVRLQSRRGVDLTAAFPEITEELEAETVDRMILDAELVALDADGRPSFNALQNRAALKHPREIAEARRQATVVLLCFDLLHFAGLNLRGNPYVDRHRYLAQCLLPSAHIQLVHASDDAEQLYAAALASGFEGIVSKRKDSTYQPGRRSQAWRKIKAVQTAEFVVGGYTEGKGSREALGSLLLGYWKGDELHYVGHVGSGIVAEDLAPLRARFGALSRKQSPFATKPPLHRPTRWLEPEIVAEVNHAGRTPDGYLRAPVFLRLRDDLLSHSIVSGPGEGAPPAAVEKSPSTEIADVLAQLEIKANRIDLRVGDARITVTNLDREYWPGDPHARQPSVTKRDLLRYLVGVSPYMLPHLEHRPLTMIRMPAGINGERFFQKHWSQARPEFVETVTVYSGHKDEQHEYLLANNLPSLIWLGQVGTLEFHVWHSRAEIGTDSASKITDYSSSRNSLESSVLNYPDYLVFDIDPYIYSGKEAKGAEPELNRKGFATGRRVAFWLRDLLQDMSLEPIVKTSGKTGLHVFVPIERTVTFDQARALCEMVGRHLMRAHPKEITMEWAIEKRTGKIFYDYNMNVRGKTLNVAYSPRGVPGAPVSMPLTWAELEAAEPNDFTLLGAVARLDRTGDRWDDLLSKKQSLAEALEGNRRKES